MSNADRLRRAGLAAFLLLAAGCTSNPAPNLWLSTPKTQQRDPYGAWIVLTPSRGPRVTGEFLAADRDSVFVLSMDDSVRAIAFADVKEAQIAYYDASTDELGVWNFAGVLSTLSNGGFLILTAPMWLIGGSIAAANQSQAPMRYLHDAGAWAAVKMFARYPAGVPAGMPRKMLHKT
ncbi:MAG TPA: hypothetical protein VE967_05815 [Gemmatimonadaceae bacterium]|nr:hypothetical protein [Gemmatimonadaceae bacterium]